MTPTVRSALPCALRAVGAAVLLSAATAASAGPISQFVVFGDSLADNGNVFALTGGAAPPAPYAQRYSNGPVGVEYMASALNVSLVDFAYGGAKSGYGNISPTLDFLATQAGLTGTGVLSQITDYGAAMGGVLDASAMYYISAGPNDFFEAGANADATTIATVIGNLQSAVTMLYSMGARQFVLPTMADLGATHAAYLQGAQAAAGATYLSTLTNQAMNALYDGLAAQWTDELFVRIDTFSLQHALLAEYTQNGVGVTSTCLADLAFPDCTGYFYFDDVHPTTAVHEAFGMAYAAAVATAVPEPASWGLAGLALLGAAGALRRGRSAATT